jgi:hypothetical protein
MENIEIRQGTNQAWFIYKNNKVLLGSHDKSVIEKARTFIKKLEDCKHKYSHYTNEHNETVAVCEKCLDAYF